MALRWFPIEIMENRFDFVAGARRRAFVTVESIDQQMHVGTLKIATVQIHRGARCIELTEQTAIQVADQICPDILLCLREGCLTSGHALKSGTIDQSRQKFPVGCSQRISTPGANPPENLRIEQCCGSSESPVHEEHRCVALAPRAHRLERRSPPLRLISSLNHAANQFGYRQKFIVPLRNQCGVQLCKSAVIT